MAGSPQTASATARAWAELDTVIPAGKAKCRWFWGRALTRLTTSLVTVAGAEHSAALLPVPAGLLLAGLAGWVALDVVAAWLPHAAVRRAVPAAARTSCPGRVTRPDRVPGTPMVFSRSLASQVGRK
jgi:hypothetical protein